MAEDLIRYDILCQEALRGVMRKVLVEVARTGLPGNHHFFITFVTGAPGVRISSRMLAQYPEDMTIVLQHQFWDLTVSEHAFEVGLSFNGIPERLHVPFNAVKGFVDPSVEFGLQFEVISEGESAEAEAEGPRLVPVEASTIPTPPAAEPVPETVVAEAVAPPAAEPAAPTPTPETGATVVSLDKFRKK